MQGWRFLMPGALGFTLKNFVHAGIDKALGKPIRPLQTVPYVAQHARPGDPQDVLRTLDRFAEEERWLMSVGPEKKKVMSKVADRLPENPRVLEFGAYCGYSSIMITDTLGPGTSVTSVEISERSVEACRANVEVAGLSSQISFVHSGSSEAIPELDGQFDLVFLDHWKPLYLADLKLLEERRLLKPGTVVIADNVGEVFGAEEYLDYVRNCGRYECENLPATIEYTQIPDAVEISVYQGSS
jgi:catechol O-methyltransferase